MLKNDANDSLPNQTISDEGLPTMPDTKFVWMKNPLFILNGQLTAWAQEIPCELENTPQKSATYKLVYVNARVFELDPKLKISKGDLPEDESLVYPASIWSREGNCPQNKNQKECMEVHIKNLLSKHGHPCLVEYYGHSLVGKEHRFIGPAYNAWSLQDWMTKFEGTLKPDWAMAFGRSVFIQLMFAIYELHRTDAYYGEPIIPAQVRMTSDGNVVLPNALGESIVTGTFTPIGRRNPQKLDICSVIKLVFDIITCQKSPTESDIKPEAVTEINFLGDDVFKNVFINILSHPEYTALDILNLLSDKHLIDPCQTSGLMWREAHQKWKDSECSSEIDRMNYHQIYFSLINDATCSSRLFLKHNLVSLLLKEDALTEHDFNWFTSQKLGSNISEIRPSFAMRRVLNLTKNQRFCRIESPNQISYDLWMIELSKWHPNISLIVKHDTKSFIVDYSDKITLKQAIERITNTAMQDFLFSVAFQVLNALVMIEFGLGCSPSTISLDTILLNTSGAVTLAVFFKKSIESNPIKKSMAELSKTLLDIAHNMPNMNTFISYADSLKEKSAFSALSDLLLTRYVPQNCKQYISQLINNGSITGTDLPTWLSSWRKALLNSNLSIEIKNNNSSNMQALCKSMIQPLMGVVQQALLSSFSNSPLNQSKPLSVLTESSTPIAVDVPFIWITGTPVLMNIQNLWHWTNQVQCMIPSDEDRARKLVFFKQEGDNNSNRILFNNGSFQSVYINVTPLKLGLHTQMRGDDYEKQVEASIWKRSFDNVRDEPNKIEHRQSLFKKRGHPCLVEYYGFAFFNGEHRFIGQSFNGSSLKSWATKLARSLPPSLRTCFGKAVFKHLLFALYELHREGRFYGEALVPEDIRMSNEGNIAIPDALGERLIAGIQVTQNDSNQRQDILSLIQLTHSIITDNIGHTIDAVTVGKIKKSVSGDDIFKFGLIQILENPDLSVFNIIQLFNEYKLIEPTIEPHQHKDKYLSAVNEALAESRGFLKNIIVPMLSHKKAFVSSQDEWMIMANLSSSVDMVQLSDEYLKRLVLKIDNPLACVKNLILDEAPINNKLLRRAITILERAHHPHIIAMYAGTRLNEKVQLITEYAEEGSLAKLIPYLESDSRLEFLRAVTVQVLQALVYLHEVLGVAHRDITAENIVFDKKGCVKLIGFAANRSESELKTSDMEELSNTLLKLLPEIPEARRFREFASNTLPSMPAVEALNRPELNIFFTKIDPNWTETQDVKEKCNFDVTSLKSVMNSYKEKSKNPQDEDRFKYRFHMKELILKMSSKAIEYIKPHLIRVKNNLNNQPRLNHQGLEALKSGSPIENGVPFFWMNGDNYRSNAQRNHSREPVILANHDEHPTSQRRLFQISNFEQVCINQCTQGEHRDPISSLHIWARQGLPFNTNREEYVTALLAKRNHPHILEYSDYMPIESEHRFMGQESSSKWWSLEAWMDKLILTPSVANKFGQAVFIQLLFALYELHEEKSFYGECLFPSDIRISDEGSVVIPNARGERLVAGTESSIIKNPQRKDIQSIIKILHSIISWKKFETLGTSTAKEIVNNPSFKNNEIFKRVLEELIFNDSEKTVCSILRSMSDVGFLKSFSAWERECVESSQKRQAHLSEILNLTQSSREYIKNELVPMVSLPGFPTVTSESDQNIQKVLGGGRFLVNLPTTLQTSVKISKEKEGNAWGYLKQVALSSRPELYLLQENRHPNIIKVFAVSYSNGNMMNILMEYGIHKSLGEIIQYVPKQNIVHFLFAMSAQVLNALLYIDIKYPELQANLSMDNILFFGNGLVKLSGLKTKESPSSDFLPSTRQLSEIILRQIPENTEENFGLREFADRIATITPLDALNDNAISDFFNNDCNETFIYYAASQDIDQVRRLSSHLENLRSINILGNTLSESITSWKKCDDKGINVENKSIIDEMMAFIITVFEQKSISLMVNLYDTIVKFPNYPLIGKSKKFFSVAMEKDGPGQITPSISTDSAFFRPVSSGNIALLRTVTAKNAPGG